MTDVLTNTVRTLGGRYDIVAEIGSGAMATVYRARDRQYDRDVAVKILHLAMCEALASQRFLREIQIEARLQHPHIIGLFDSGEVDGCPYYVMPLVEGETLRARLKRDGPLPVPEALRIAEEIGTALSYAHGQGVIHRDIKPANILLSSGVAMLADFGIARAASEVGGSDLTEKGIAVGTPSYMSPEQAGGDGVVDVRSDIYALGCVLFEMLAGEPPFTGRTTQAVMARHILEPVPSLEVVRPGLSRSIVVVVERALAKIPVDRFATADEFITALKATAVETGPRKRGRAFIGTTALAVALALAAALALWPERPALDRSKVVVFPLEERGLPPTEAGAGIDLALMIAAALEHADPLRPLDIRDRLSPAQSARPDLITAAQRRSIAIERGAGLYIAGVIQGFRDSTTVILRLYDVAGDSIVAGRAVGGMRQLAAVHQLGIDAAKSLIPSLIDPGRDIDLTPLRDRNAGAIALFVQGEREYRLSNFKSALAHYERALGADSALALAAVKGAQAASWVKDAQKASDLVQLAISRDSLLPTRYSQYARGLGAFLAGDADSAVAWFERASRTTPGWAEASMALGEVYYHLVPLRPRLDSLAAAAFNAALASDSGFTPPLFHLAEIAIRSGDVTRGRFLIDRFIRHRPSAQLVTHLELMLECTVRGHREFDWSQAVPTASREVLSAGKALSGAGLKLGCADGAFRSLLASDQVEYHWGALLGHHAVLAATGQHQRLIAVVDSTVERGTLRQAMMAYIADTIAGLPVGAKAREVEAFGKGRWGTRYEGLAGQPGRNWLQWLFGIWHAQLGDTAMVRVIQARLDSAPPAIGALDPRFYAQALSAHLALGMRDTSGAIERFRQLASRASFDDLEWEWGLPLAVERIRLAEIYLARGQHREAHDVATIFDHPGPIAHLVFLPRSLAIRYRAATALGRRDAAIGYRKRLTELGRLDLVEALK